MTIPPPRLSPNPDRSPVKGTLLLTVLSALVLFPALGQNNHWASREVRHAEIIREMADRGDYLIPRLLGDVYYDKPPIMHAPAALLSRLTGHCTMGLARLPSAVAGLVAVLVTYALGLQLLDRSSALVSALLLLSMPGFNTMARKARPDMVFCATLLVACVILAWAMKGSTRWLRSMGFFSAGTFSGLATLTKGPLGIVMPLLFLLWVPFRHSTFRRNRWEWLVFLLGFLALISTWVLLVCHRAGGSYLWGVIFQPDLSFTDEDRQTWYHLTYYLWNGILPALPVLIFLPLIFRERTALRYSPSLLIAGSFVAILSAIPKKRPHYILPAFPFLALGVAPSLVRASHENQRVKHLGWAVVAVSIVAVPVFYAVVQPLVHPGPDSHLAFATTVFDTAGPEATLYCFDDAEPFAWVAGSYARIRQLRPNKSAASVLLRADFGRDYLVAKEATIGRLARRSALPPLYKVPNVRDHHHDLHLYRIGNATDSPSSEAAERPHSAS